MRSRFALENCQRALFYIVSFSFSLFFFSDFYMSSEHVPGVYHSLWHIWICDKLWVPDLSPLGELCTWNLSEYKGWLCGWRGHCYISAGLLLLYNCPQYCRAYIPVCQVSEAIKLGLTSLYVSFLETSLAKKNQICHLWTLNFFYCYYIKEKQLTFQFL